MTIVTFASLMARRWYLFVIALGCVLVGSFYLNSGQRVFVTTAEFVMVGPGTSLGFEPPGDTRETLINFADVVSRTLNAEHPTYGLSSPAATLFGNGLRSGVSVRLANSGSQWNSSFASPVITVQILDSSAEKVQGQLNEVTKSINTITRDIQVGSGARPATLITADSDPTRIIISSFGPTRTSKTKGVAVMASVAVCIATIIGKGLDWRAKRQVGVADAIGGSSRTLVPDNHAGRELVDR